MKIFIYIFTNIILIAIFVLLMRKKNLLSYFDQGKWFLTFFAIAIITLMDELTSIFYAPSEAFRFIGTNAIFYIAFTSILIRFLSTRMVEIGEILEVNNIKGGGVYNFSYLVLGPVISFIAVASIIVDYILTASISTVSAVENGTSFINLSITAKFVLEVAIIWAIAGLNILGIKENAKFTFGIFIFAAFVLVNLILAGILNVNLSQLAVMKDSAVNSTKQLYNGGIFNSYYILIASISSCILAYSGVESVLQTSGLVKSWRDIGRAYIFLALTVGIVTPLISALSLSENINLKEHETDLITYFAVHVANVPFGMIVAVLASITLIMAVNTAYIASSELMERVAHRYGFDWIIKTNRHNSLYRLHITNAILYTFIIFVTNGSQGTLAEMYALGLVASFVINIGSLLIYRYFKGTKEVHAYNTSRTGTLFLFLILFSCFLYLAYHKPYGTVLLGVATAISLIAGIIVAQKRSPEIVEVEKAEKPMDLIFHIAESDKKNVHICFKRPRDLEITKAYDLTVFVSFFSPRERIPPKISENHFRFPVKKATIINKIRALLHLISYELSDKNITVHVGWPASSWLDRMSIGVMVYNITKLPNEFPNLNFKIESFKKR
ncbi:MAG: APC family permease [Nitrospinae bacterium]|nr:APC family permease [Nitrospinota bacterium]